MTDIRRAPEFRDLLVRASMSRRGFLRGMGLTGAAAVTLAGCGTKGAAVKSGAAKTAPDRSDQDKSLNFSNWPLYIDIDAKDSSKRPTLDAFTQQTGIKVNYNEDVNDNDEFFGKVKPQLAAGQDTKRDIMVLTDWMASRLIRLNWAEPFDMANLPNAKNLRKALQNPSWDPNRAHTMPWQSGLTGIAYNKKATGGKAVTSMGQLLTDPDLKGKVTCLTEMRDTVGLVLLDMGIKPEDCTDADFANALDKLKAAVSSGQIRQFTGNEYAAQLGKGAIAAAMAWSGDVIQLQSDNPDIEFVVPDAGLMIFSDNMMIPNLADHKKNAEMLINYYYQPEVAAELAAYVNYICPVEGAQEAMKSIDAKLAANPLIFPDDSTLAKTHEFKSLDEHQETDYANRFAEVTGA